MAFGEGSLIVRPIPVASREASPIGRPIPVASGEGSLMSDLYESAPARRRE